MTPRDCCCHVDTFYSRVMAKFLILVLEGSNLCQIHRLAAVIGPLTVGQTTRVLMSASCGCYVHIFK